MALSAKLQKAISEQINAEFYSSYLYLAMAVHLTEKNMPGCAHWMRMQAQEEVAHAMKFYSYINDRRGRILMKEIKCPPAEWESALDAFQDAFAHEQEVTRRINALVDLALEEKDHNTNSFLKWFVDEQVEEEASVDEVVQKLKLIGGDGGGLFMVDQELGQRTFTPPAAEE